MYNRTLWLDHAVTPDRTFRITDNGDGTVTLTPAGRVIQQGTNMSAAHFNNIEVGISDVSLALSLVQFKQTQDNFDYEDELQVVDLAMNSLPWPFNNRETTIGLKNLRESINYSVEVNVLSYSGGRLGNIRVVDRARNGFKLVHDGSATHVRVSVRVSGGMTYPILKN